MRIFGNLFKKKSLQSVQSLGGWTSVYINEPYSGAWQQNKELTREDLAQHHAVFACVSLISKDIGKLPITLKTQKKGVFVDAPMDDLRYRVLKKPNRYQTWQQFNEQWTVSLLLRGNTYVLMQRDIFGEVMGFVILNPDRCKPLLDDAGNVYYQLHQDRLTQAEDMAIPASEIIHDRINCLYHPLVGVSPITACSMAAGHGLEIQKNSRSLFSNFSRPSGILTAPGAIPEEKALKMQERWNANYSGVNAGKTAVMGDGMTFHPITISAIDSQLIEQLRMTSEIICSVFHVPQFKIGLSAATGKVSELNEIYYSDCLQSYIESREALIDQALDLKARGVEVFFDLSVLIRMDSATQMAQLKEAVGAGIMKPNEARAKIGLLPVRGGDTVYLQQQNYSIEALSRRDAREDPFSPKPSATPAALPQNPPETEQKGQYKGVFNTESAYKTGDFVTKNGSLWHCERDCSGEFDHQNFKLAQKKWGES